MPPNRSQRDYHFYWYKVSNRWNLAIAPTWLKWDLILDGLKILHVLFLANFHTKFFTWSKCVATSRVALMGNHYCITSGWCCCHAFRYLRQIQTLSTVQTSQSGQMIHAKILHQIHELLYVQTVQTLVDVQRKILADLVMYTELYHFQHRWLLCMRYLC